MRNSLKDKIIIVTGAGSGIGLATADMLEAEGAKVYRASRSGEICLDVRDSTSVANAVTAIVNRENKIDILVHCAGVGVSGPFEYMNDEIFNLQFDTNVNGTVRMCRSVFPEMRKQGAGRIIVIGSVAGRISIPFQSAYSASKAAISSLILAMRSEVKKFGIQCAVVEPGDTKTGFTANRVKADFPENDEYKNICDAAVSQMEHDEEHGDPPEKIARIIIKLLKKKRMPARVVCGFGYKALSLLSRLLPDRIIEFVVAQIYHIKL